MLFFMAKRKSNALFDPPITYGKLLMIPKQPEAGYIRASFEEIAKGPDTISKVRKYAVLNGFVYA